MNSASRYSGSYIFVKGRMTAGLTTFADVGACNIALDQNGLLSTPAIRVLALGASTGIVCHAAMAIAGR